MFGVTKITPGESYDQNDQEKYWKSFRSQTTPILQILFQISILQCLMSRKLLLNRYIQACQGSFSSKLDYHPKSENDQKDLPYQFKEGLP